MKILMVCLGNICRSPMAEGILQQKIDSAGFDIKIDSCGTGAWHVGESPDRRAQAIMISKGMDISQLRARQFSKTDFSDFDFIYVMDDSNYKDVVRLADNEEEESRVRLILNESNPNSNTPVPDPYYGGVNGFETVFRLLDNACDMIINRLSE